MSTVTRYPLSWPSGWKRTEWARRRQSTFHRGTSASSRNLTIGDGLDRLLGELGRIGARNVIISSDVPVRLDGLPYASASLPKDPGCAVYFRLKNADRCLACDAFHRLPDNMAALAGHIAALRAIDRYGVGTIDQAFAGYTALPAAAEVEWWLTLQVPRSAPWASIDAAYRELAKRAHPDVAGGSESEMQRLNVARDAARREKQA